MTRISLRETYDNRSVIAQIAKVTDTAEDAAETVQQKAAEINDALTDVNAAVQAAEGAVTTANSASASAQASAQTVAGYENRLGAVEDATEDLSGDLNAVTLRITTAEGQIVTIQGRVTAIEGNYLKKSGDPQTVVSQINVPTTATGIRDTQIANGTRIQNDLDNYQAMMRLANLQSYTGVKELLKTANILPSLIKITDVSSTEHPSLIYLTGIRNNDGTWLVEDRLGTDNDGARGFYSKGFKIYLNDTEYTINVRLNLTASGVQIQIFDPINTAWRTVQLV